MSGQSLTQRENASVENYLRFLATGEVPTSPSKASRLEALDARIEAEDRLYRKAVLIGERHALAAETVTGDDLKAAFVKDVGGFMARNPAVTYPVWREMGVTPGVLKEAGVTGAPATARPAGTPPRTRRNLNDPNLAREMLAYAIEHGGDATAEHYGYKRSYIGTACRELAKRFPKIADELHYRQDVVFPYMNPHERARKAASK